MAILVNGALKVLISRFMPVLSILVMINGANFWLSLTSCYFNCGSYILIYLAHVPCRYCFCYGIYLLMVYFPVFLRCLAFVAFVMNAE